MWTLALSTKVRAELVVLRRDHGFGERRRDPPLVGDPFLLDPMALGEADEHQRRRRRGQDAEDEDQRRRAGDQEHEEELDQAPEPLPTRRGRSVSRRARLWWRVGPH